MSGASARCGRRAPAGFLYQPAGKLPAQPGPNLPPEGEDGLEVVIRPLSQTVRLGQPIRFDILIYNRNGYPVTLPRNPRIELVWIYPNGRRDSTVHEVTSARFFTRRDVIELPPGHALRATVSVPSYYFPEPGITEFRAVLQTAENLNPQITNYWSGRCYSNSYGILVLPSDRM